MEFCGESPHKGSDSHIVSPKISYDRVSGVLNHFSRGMGGFSCDGECPCLVKTAYAKISVVGA